MMNQITKRIDCAPLLEQAGSRFTEDGLLFSAINIRTKDRRKFGGVPALTGQIYSSEVQLLFARGFLVKPSKSAHALTR